MPSARSANQAPLCKAAALALAGWVIAARRREVFGWADWIVNGGRVSCAPA